MKKDSVGEKGRNKSQLPLKVVPQGHKSFSFSNEKAAPATESDERVLE